MNRIFLIVLIGMLYFGCETKKQSEGKAKATAKQNKVKPKVIETFKPQYILKAENPIVLDGTGNEKDWDKANWRNLDQLMLGSMPSEEDFSGRYKLLWDEDMLYALAVIQDDVFMDNHEDGLDKYWDDDCLEIFIDQDRSRGDHQYNYNAFAYHVSLDDKVVDLSIEKLPKYFNDHLIVSKTKEENKITWEIGIKIYSDEYDDDKPTASRVKLAQNDKMGFMLAYCDNDSSPEREHFMGDMFIKGEDKN